MFYRGLVVLGAALVLGVGSVAAEVITIDKEPQQLIELRKNYLEQRQNAVTAAEIAKAEKEFEQARQSALVSDSYRAKKLAIEKAQQKELAAIKARYQKELQKLEQGTLAAVDKQYEKKNAALKEKEVGKLHSNFLASLQKLEKELIAKSDLAGALVVQTERKKMSGVDPQQPLPAELAAKAQEEKAARAAAAAEPPAAPGPEWMTQDNQVHVSSVRGVAGAEGNISNNIYTFRLDKPADNAKLVFYGYGNRNSNKSYGEVYLIAPDGNRSEVAEWNPDVLDGPKFEDVKVYTDVKPVETDISSQMKQAGQYRVEFQYKDGDEALNIYRVELQTW